MKRFLVLMTGTLLIMLLLTGVILGQDVQIITGIAVEGNETVSDQEVLSVIRTKAGDLLDEEKLKADLQAIIDLGYFKDAKISFEVYKGGLKAIFELVENPVIREIILQGNDVLDQETLLSLSVVKTGEILNTNELVETRKRIEGEYRDRGYVLARFSDIDVSPDGVLTLTVNEGYLNRVIIKGNEKTKDFVILRELDYSEGQVLNFKELQQGYQNLLRLNFFEDIEAHFERVEGEEGANKADLIIDVTEAKTGNLGAGVTWSSKDGWLGFVNIRERNLLGNGQTINFNWEFGGSTNYSLSFKEPWLFNTPTSFGINLYDRKSTTTNSDDEEYTEKRRGGSISFGHALTEEWDGLVRFKVEDSELDYKADDTKDEDKTVRSITLQASRDNLDPYGDPFNPTEGGIDTVSVEYAGQMLGGDTNFTKYNLELRRYYPGFKGSQAWALRLKTGISDSSLPELEKYRLGGSETLRGYDYGAFSGDEMMLFNIEYRFPIADNFTGVVFADGGKTWDKYEEISLNGMHYSLGAGLRMNTPIGQIRLDYGFNEEGNGQPHFSLGHTF